MKIIAEIQKANEGVIVANYEGFIPELDLSKMYDIEIKEHKSKRSLEANRMLWGILQKIKEETDNDLMDLYIEVLEKADAKYDFLMVLPETVEELKKVFRAVKILEYREYNGKQMAVIKAYIGSSKFNTKEMSILIDKAMQVASENGIAIDINDF